MFIGVVLFILLTPKLICHGPGRRIMALADIKGIEEAVQLYTRDCGAVPTAEQGLAVLLPHDGQAAACSSYNANGYIDRLPIDPWGHPYLYVSDGKRFIIRTYGADGKDGGEGVDADIDNESIRDFW